PEANGLVEERMGVLPRRRPLASRSDFDSSEHERGLLTLMKDEPSFDTAFRDLQRLVSRQRERQPWPLEDRAVGFEDRLRPNPRVIERGLTDETEAQAPAHDRNAPDDLVFGL